MAFHAERVAVVPLAAQQVQERSELFRRYLLSLKSCLFIIDWNRSLDLADNSEITVLFTMSSFKHHIKTSEQSNRDKLVF